MDKCGFRGSGLSAYLCTWRSSHFGDVSCAECGKKSMGRNCLLFKFDCYLPKIRYESFLCGWNVNKSIKALTAFHWKVFSRTMFLKTFRKMSPSANEHSAAWPRLAMSVLIHETCFLLYIAIYAICEQTGLIMNIVMIYCFHNVARTAFVKPLCPCFLSSGLQSSSLYWSGNVNGLAAVAT